LSLNSDIRIREIADPLEFQRIITLEVRFAETGRIMDNRLGDKENRLYGSLNIGIEVEFRMEARNSILKTVTFRFGFPVHHNGF